MMKNLRRTGRTKRQVEQAVREARAGAAVTYVVPHSGLAGYVLDMIRDCFGAGLKRISRTQRIADYGTGSVRVLVASGLDDNRLRGRTDPIVDHFARELWAVQPGGGR